MSFAERRTFGVEGPLLASQSPHSVIADLLAGKKLEYPRFAVDPTHKKAPKARKAAEEQITLGETEIEEPF